MFKKILLVMVVGVFAVTEAFAVSVSITNPNNGVSVLGTVSFDATATSTTGVITTVGFYVDDVFKSSDTSSPYSYSWDTTLCSNNSHTLKTIAVDTSSQTATAQISVTVNNVAPDNPPTVSITSPTNGAIVSGTVVVTSSATDDNGINRVAFYVDGVLKFSDTSAPYSYSWDTTLYSNAGHTLSVIAYDTILQTATAQISVTVSNNYSVTSSTPTSSGISIEIKPTQTVINPAKGQETKVDFMVGGKTAQTGEIVHVTVEIYNARRELVKTLMDEDMSVGAYQVMWNGRNFEDDIVASGVYIVRLKAGNHTASKKIVVIK